MRLAALVTVAVGLALALASVTLVTSMSRTLVGGVEAAAEHELDRVAEELSRGRPPAAKVETPPEHLTIIQIKDEQGRVLRKIPETAADLPAGPGDLEARRAQTRGEPGGAVNSDDLVVASRTVATPDGVRTVLAISRLGGITNSFDVLVGSLLVATPLLTILVALLTWFAVDRALRPVEAIRRRADAISHSTLSERLPPPETGDEVERLTTTLNEMLDRLDEGARRQREFVSDASHELRTPLAAMRADLEVSLAHRDAADWRTVAGRLLDDHRRLDRLTSDLLMLARSDDLTEHGRAEPVRLDEIVAGELSAVSRAELTFDLEPVQCTGAVQELARLARNLLDNADRHAARRVDVRLGRVHGTVVFTVDDDGPGIPAVQRDRVFDRFYRLDGSRGRDRGGVGLGLAMVRGIARRHGGDVTVADAPLGGARFELRLPG